MNKNKNQDILKDRGIITSIELEAISDKEWVPKTTVEHQHMLNLLANGTRVSDVCKIMNIEKKTLSYWIRSHKKEIEDRKAILKKAVNKVYDNEITGLANEIVIKGHEILKHINEAKMSKAGVSQLSIAFGIMVDKMRLLTDQSTNNINIKFSNRESALGYLRNGGLNKEAIDV